MGIFWPPPPPYKSEPVKTDPDAGKRYIVATVRKGYTDDPSCERDTYKDAEDEAKRLVEKHNVAFSIYTRVAVVEPDMAVNVRRVANPDEAGQ